VSIRYAILCFILQICVVSAEEKKRSDLPDGRTIDTFAYRNKFKFHGPMVDLSITRKGKIHYLYSTAPHTGSGGRVVNKDWEISSEDASILLDGLVSDGLLNAKVIYNEKDFPSHHVTMSYGEWQRSHYLKELPDKVYQRILPLMNKVHPEVWTIKKESESDKKNAEELIDKDGWSKPDNGVQARLKLVPSKKDQRNAVDYDLP
jgi:hypothetical protein